MREPAPSAGSLHEIEAWFVWRGVPLFVESYMTERRIDARAGRFVIAERTMRF